MEEFLVSLTVYLLWVYDGRFGSLLGPVGIRVTLGTLCRHLGRMLGINASGVPQIGKKTQFPMVFTAFMRTQFKCIPQVHQMYVKCLSGFFETYVRGISVVYEMYCQQLKKAAHVICYRLKCYMPYAVCYLLDVTCYMLCFVCYTLYVIRYMLYVV